MHFEHISKMMSEIRNLEKLNSNLLLLSKEDINTSNEITKFNLNDFINDISDFYMDLSEIKGINFKYTNENGDISLIFENINKNIKVRVKDTGIGLSLLKSICNNLGIKIKVISEPNIGSELKIYSTKNDAA